MSELEKDVQEVSQEVSQEVVEVMQEVTKEAVEVTQEAVQESTVDVVSDEAQVEPQFVSEETVAPVEQEESMDDYLDMLDSSMMRFHSGDLVDGEVIGVTDTEILVNFGYISDGVVPVTETFADMEHPLTSQYKIGDRVKAEVIRKDDGDGNVLLSLKKAQGEVVWENLTLAMNEGRIIEAQVTEAVKGGLVCKALQARAFMPGSMVSTSFVSDLSEYNGKILRVKIMELDREKDKVIISHKVIEQAEREVKKEALFGSLKKGDVFTGTVRKNMHFGSFVDIGGVDGLVHISDLSWNKVTHPSDVVKEGDKVKVTVISIDIAKQKIGLSMKDINEDPWEALASSLIVGKNYDGKVKKIMEFGAFVEIIPTVEGLVHISEMSSNRINHPTEVVREGGDVVVKVLAVDLKQRKIKLTMKVDEDVVVEEIIVEASEYESSEQATTNLGSVFGDLFKNLK